MRVIPVLDLRGGRAAHATGGTRARYRPVRSRLAAGDDPAVLAAAFRDVLGTRECYVADLDAIDGGAVQIGTIRTIASGALTVWADAGTAEPGRARELLDAGANVVVGLETLTSADHLRAIAAEVAADRLAFSLDLRNGRPIARVPELAEATPADLLDLAVRAGFGRVIVLDLARIGARTGPPVALVRKLRRRFPDLEMIAGGGVRGPDDLRRLARAGCVGALVGTALHTGRIVREDLEAVERL